MDTGDPLPPPKAWTLHDTLDLALEALATDKLEKPLPEQQQRRELFIKELKEVTVDRELTQAVARIVFFHTKEVIKANLPLGFIFLANFLNNLPK